MSFLRMKKKLIRESLAFDSQIAFNALSKLNSTFREFTNYIFHVLSKEMGPSDAAGLVSWSEDELKAMYDEGFNGVQTIKTLKQLDDEHYIFKTKKFNKPHMMSESLRNTFKPKDLSLVYADKKYDDANGPEDYVMDVYKLVNIKMLFRPLTVNEFIKDETILQELAKGFSKKENPATTAKRIKSYMKGAGLFIK